MGKEFYYVINKSVEYLLTIKKQEGKKLYYENCNL